MVNIFLIKAEVIDFVYIASLSNSNFEVLSKLLKLHFRYTCIFLLRLVSVRTFDENAAKIRFIHETLSLRSAIFHDRIAL